MIKLKSETWYYLYTDGKDVFISETAPVREDQHWYYPKRWYHFKHQYRTAGPPLRISDPKSSFMGFDHVHRINYGKEN